VLVQLVYLRLRTTFYGCLGALLNTFPPSASFPSLKVLSIRHLYFHQRHWKAEGGMSALNLVQHLARLVPNIEEIIVEDGDTNHAYVRPDVSSCVEYTFD
jgi:hypothetical protein